MDVLLLNSNIQSEAKKASLLKAFIQQIDSSGTLPELYGKSIISQTASPLR